ncbi:MAG TPA: TadE family protein [Blastocatellia bacterium]|nr:TadE family protein [Blastocatellia bacterium]
MRKALNRTAHHSQRGQAIVEFALVLPVLCLLLVGMLFFARAYNLQQVLNGAAREGARAWAKNPAGGAWFQCGNMKCDSPDPTPEDTNFYRFVMPAVRNYIRDSGFADANVTFFTSQSGSAEQARIKEMVTTLDANNDQVTITIYYPYTLPVGGLGSFAQIFLRASCTMKRG